MAAPSWPVCCVRAAGPSTRGGPAIHIGNAPYTPMFFVGNNQFNRDDVLLKELRLAAEAGVPLFSFNVPLEWRATDEQAAEIVDKFCKAHPDGYFYVRIFLGANEKWLAEHPDECIAKCIEEAGKPSSFERLGWASPGSTAWREATAGMLADCVRQIATGPLGAHFIGVELEYLTTAEWYYPEPDSFTDYSPANLAAFRAWLRRGYKSDRALRKAWNDSNASIDGATLPTPAPREAAGWGPFRDPRANRSAMDLQRFQSELVADTIAYFAGIVKEATARRSLVGAYYGYTMEINDNGPRALVQSGHLALERLLDCKDLDILHAPYSYFQREAGQPGHLHGPLDSVALHGKLFVLEDDTYTHRSEKPAEGLIAPGWEARTQSIDETLSVARRTFGYALTHRTGIWYFDLLSDGRWQDAQFWQAMPLFRRMEAEMRSEPPFQPQVAFVVSEQAPHAMRATTWPVLLQSLSWWRAELDRIGTPVGYYLQSDLPNLPESVRVIVLADAFVIDKTERRAIEKWLDRGATIVWTYAPDIVGPHGIDCRRIGDITGIAVEPRSDDTPMTISSALTDEEIAIDPSSWNPRFVVTAKEMDVVARYKATNEVSAAARPMRNGVSVYTATPRLPVGLMRTICARAGVHLYRNTPGMTGVAGHYLIVHTENEGMHTFQWPHPCHTVERIAPPKRSAVPVDADRRWSDVLPARTTAIYACYGD